MFASERSSSRYRVWSARSSAELYRGWEEKWRSLEKGQEWVEVSFSGHSGAVRSERRREKEAPPGSGGLALLSAVYSRNPRRARGGELETGETASDGA